MLKKLLIILLTLYLLALVQVSFLPHFHIQGRILNLVALAVLLFSFLEKEESNLGYWAAFFGGAFLDIFSSKPLGFYILIMLGLSFFIKNVLKRYIRPARGIARPCPRIFYGEISSRQKTQNPAQARN